MPVANHKEKDFKIFLQILQRINKIQKASWRNGVNLCKENVGEVTNRNYQTIISGLFSPIEDQELDKVIGDSLRNSMQISIGNLFLPPLAQNKDFIPVLSLNCDFSSSPIYMRLCVGMFSFSDDGELQLLAFRFELNQPNSNHDYCHGQFTRAFSKEKNSPSIRRVEEVTPVFDSLPNWMPESTPCMVVPAKCPVSLLFCLLISFYGKSISNFISDLNIDGTYFETFELLNILS